MSDEIKLRFKQMMQKLWCGRKSRTTFLLAAAFYVAIILAVSWPADMVHSVAPKLLWELYVAFMVTAVLGSVLGIGRIYVQRLHDIGMSGYWAFVALIVAPSALIYLSSEYSSWRWQSDNSFPTGDWNDAVGYVILAAIVIFSLFRGSDDDNAFGAKPEAVSLPQTDFQVRWTAISVAAFGLPYFAYIGFFNDRIWVGKLDFVEMPDHLTNAPGRAFMHCWGFKGIGAYWNDDKDRKNSLVTFDNGFTKDGYGNDVFALYIDGQGSIDIVSDGKSSVSFKKDGFDIVLNNPKNINFREYGWHKSVSAKTFMVTASAYIPSESLQNETILTFMKDDDFLGYKAILTRNFMKGQGGMVGSYVNGQVMIGNCMAQ